MAESESTINLLKFLFLSESLVEIFISIVTENVFKSFETFQFNYGNRAKMFPEIWDFQNNFKTFAPLTKCMSIIQSSKKIMSNLIELGLHRKGMAITSSAFLHFAINEKYVVKNVESGRLSYQIFYEYLAAQKKI